MSNIFVGVDGSSASKVAVRWAARDAWMRNAASPSCTSCPHRRRPGHGPHRPLASLSGRKDKGTESLPMRSRLPSRASMVAVISTVSCWLGRRSPR